jgi:hypothetical protein
MTGPSSRQDAAAEPAASDDVAALLRSELARLKEERDSLLVHSRNLEAELRRRGRETAQLRDLERRLAEAEARLRQVSFVSMGRWLLLQPRRALGSLYRRFRQSVPFLLLKPFPAVRRTVRRFRP